MLVKSFSNSTNFQNTKQKPVAFTSQHFIKKGTFCNSIDKDRAMDEVKELFGKTAIEDKFDGIYIDVPNKYDVTLQKLLNNLDINYRILH